MTKTITPELITNTRSLLSNRGYVNSLSKFLCLRAMRIAFPSDSENSRRAMLRDYIELLEKGKEKGDLYTILFDVSECYHADFLIFLMNRENKNDEDWNLIERYVKLPVDSREWRQFDFVITLEDFVSVFEHKDIAEDNWITYSKSITLEEIKEIYNDDEDAIERYQGAYVGLGLTWFKSKLEEDFASGNIELVELIKIAAERSKTVTLK